MRDNSLVLRALIGALAVLLVASAPNLNAAQRDKGLVGLVRAGDRGDRQMEALKEEVRHQLLMLPYYTVFDWLQAEVKPDGTVTLMGQVVRPTLKDDAERNIRKLEAATKVINDFLQWTSSSGSPLTEKSITSKPHCSAMPHGPVRRSTSS